jgi:D-arabinose 1-dehydrogenase-like Zn-dependent alcohol dehydrogenase
LKEHLGKYDFVLNTAPVGSSILREYVKLWAPSAKFIQFGVPHVAENMIISFIPVVMKEVKIIGGLVGNLEDIRKMLELCAQEDIYPLVEEFSSE